MNDYVTIGEIIKYYRLKKGFSQQQLADGICTRKYIGQLEKNINIPTLDIINKLSQKLQINLYDTYALMLRHHDIETHLKIEYINQNLHEDKIEHLLPFIEQCENLPEFQNGEPAQCLLYAKSVYTSNLLKQYDSAISLAIKALSINDSFDINTISPIRLYSNVELTLLNLILVNYCRLSNFSEGKKYFELIKKYLIDFFQTSHYATNRNNQFEIKLLSTITYNYFSFFKDDSNFDITNIEQTMELMKNLHCTYNLPQLLLCKTYYLAKDNRITEAKSNYTLAHHLGLYMYSYDYMIEKELEILDSYYSMLQ